MSSSDFGEYTRPIARHEHRCEYCYGPIPKDEKHSQYKGMWEGEWQNWRMHDECYEEYIAAEPCDGFMPGDAPMPDRVKVLLDAVRGKK